jgi:glycosyltransferase involved in cell wall biosynthesis
MPLYQNMNGYTVSLTGQDGSIVKLKSRQITNLPEYFEMYRERGFITLLSDEQLPIPLTPLISNLRPQVQAKVTRIEPRPRKIIHQNIRVPNKITFPVQKPALSKSMVPHLASKSKLVGKVSKIKPEMIEKNSDRQWYPISNNIGVGILSYNRLTSLRRCVESIEKMTDLNRTTVFISDDNSDDAELIEYLKQLEQTSNIVVIRNPKRLGIAGNTNRLLRALKRFDYGFVLNDDIEIIDNDWDTFYVEGLQRSGLHHLVFRQAGVYGAALGEPTIIKDQLLHKVVERPQGAFLAFTRQCLELIGPFDEEYGIYGMEHIDWSTRVSDYKLQSPGYFDIVDSDRYIKLHNDLSSVKEKDTLLRAAKCKFSSSRNKVCEYTDETEIPSISVVIPFREQERTKALKSVINNIRAQKFPNIELILIEEDHVTRIEKKDYEPFTYSRVQIDTKHHFNKSKAFNLGVSISNYDKIILHDADMMVTNHYVQEVYDCLNEYEACHIGATVLYADYNTTEQINEAQMVIKPVMERVVGYYEGGSLACRKDAYWRIGGFNEDFWGYGCEDCDFYYRLSKGTTWKEDRRHDLLHLRHGRSDGWNECHEANKAIDKELSKLSLAQRIEKQQQQLKLAGYIT